MRRLSVIVAAFMLFSACGKRNTPPSPDNLPADDSFWAGKLYRYTSWPSMYPGLKRMGELQFVSGSEFIQRQVDYQNNDSFESIHYHNFTFDPTSGYIVITSGNNPPTLSSNLLKYAGDSILRISLMNTDTIILDNPYLRIK